MKKIPNPNKMKRVAGPRLTRKAVERAKVRITTYLDKNVVELLRQAAIDSGGRYQTLLNQILRDYLLGEKEGIMARLMRLEKMVFKAKAA